MLKWLIIGGGLQGTYLSHLLTHHLAIPADRLRVLDDHAEPLTVWRHRTANCGMGHLRSPATHNIDLGIMSLRHFVKGRGGPVDDDFIPPYYRPSLSLFNAHCASVIERYGLQDLRLAGRALDVHPARNGLRVDTTSGVLTTERILLALGQSQPCEPAWARFLRSDGARVNHLFDLDFDRSRVRGGGHRVIVIGGGISAAQCALAMEKQVGPPVTLLSRHPLAESQFDFDPCWIGPKCLTAFYQQPYDRRRAIVDGARLPGTLPAEVLDQLRAAVAAKRVRLCTGAVLSASRAENGIELRINGAHLTGDRLILATGFEGERPGGSLVNRLIDRFRLPATPEGYPVVDGALAWHPRIYVAGALAELMVGPCARNIVGVRNAGRMLLKGLLSV
jgi:hypothetical protein